MTERPTAAAGTRAQVFGASNRLHRAGVMLPVVPRFLLVLCLPATLAAQTPPGLARERAEFAAWLTHSPRSPYAAVTLTPLTYGRLMNVRPPSFYPYRAAAVVLGRLAPVQRPRAQRLLGFDGIEVEATDAGTFDVGFDGGVTGLRVFRVPVSGTEESELTIYFRDSTSGRGSYPAGRFVTLEPLAGGRYRADFNGARNPFCAYSPVYPCPIPWPGNTIPARVAAGERYRPHDERPARPRP
jgi:uncharacterized protein (DUF1684 family)